MFRFYSLGFGGAKYIHYRTMETLGGRLYLNVGWPESLDIGYCPVSAAGGSEVEHEYAALNTVDWRKSCTT